MSINLYRRELQIARNLVTLRWASIPVIFGFCLAFIFGFKMSFKLEPIYIICCAIAVFNLYLTLHISMIGRQLSVTKGLTTLKRVMLKVLSQFFGSFKTKGLRGLAGIPTVIAKVASVIYLMFLETLKDFPINPLSLSNIMHTQILFDLAVILCLTRYTGSTESPMFFLAAIPVAVAGSVVNTKAGMIYAVLACGGWFANSMLIRYGVMEHIKFYGPIFGDLHSCDGWIASYTMVSTVSLGAFAMISHKLTQAFKEKVDDLDKSLYESRSSSVSFKHVALTQNNPWLVLDKKGKILNLKSDESELITPDMAGKGIVECIPDLIKANYEFTAQSVMSSHGFKKLNDVKIRFKDKTEHIYDMTISYYKEFDGSDRLMICFQEKTLEVNRKELVDTLRAECSHSSNSIEKLTKENAELHKSLDDLVKISSDKSIEIEVLNTKVNDMDIEASEQNAKISELMDQVAAVNAHNDQLKVELENRQMILDDVSELMNSCGQLEELIGKVERKIKNLFGLENSCFHVFNSADASHQKSEILDIRKVSPRLLDIPRNHPETLDPVLNEGRPVVFSAEFRPEKSAASIAVTNGDLKRMVAFVPVKEENELLGMMMLEKYGTDDNSESLIDMVSYYLKQAAGAIKVAIDNRKAQKKNCELHQEMVKIHNKLDSVKTMLFNDFANDVRPFGGLLYEISKLIHLRDAMLVRIHTDGTTDVCSRIDRSKQLELNVIENRIIEQLKGNYENKVTFESENGIDDCIAYPLVDKNRLIGILMIYLNDESEEIDTVTLDFCVKMLKMEFALYVLNEEREVWESFYSNSIPA